jgi:hypothetical protein
MLYFAALVVAALWPRRRGLRVKEKGRLVCNRIGCAVQTPVGPGQSLPPLRVLEARFTAVYSAMTAQAIQRIQRT